MACCGSRPLPAGGQAGQSRRRLTVAGCLTYRLPGFIPWPIRRTAQVGGKSLLASAIQSRPWAALLSAASWPRRGAQGDRAEIVREVADAVSLAVQARKTRPRTHRYIWD